MRLTMRRQVSPAGTAAAPNRLRRRVLGAGAMIALAPAALRVGAQDYPSRALRLVIPQPPGGGFDILGRNVAPRLGTVLGQPVIVENRPGAGSLVGTEHVAKSAADGYTLLLGGVSNLALNPALFKSISYDPLRDFVPVGYASTYPFLLLARPDLPAASLPDFVKHAKERPGKLTFGSAGLGTAQHVWGEILLKSLGLDLVHVPFKGAAPGHQDMMAGRIDVMFDNMSSTRQFVEGGRLKALAVSSASRVPEMPNVPTIKETGLDFEVGSWFGFFVPAATPAPAVTKIREALAQVFAQKEFVEQVEKGGGRVLGIAASDQQRFLENEVQRWGRLVRQFGIKAE